MSSKKGLCELVDGVLLKKTVGVKESFEGGEVLPGFSLPISELFAFKRRSRR